MEAVSRLREEIIEQFAKLGVTAFIPNEAVTLEINGVETHSWSIHNNPARLFAVKLDDHVFLDLPVLRILLTYWEKRAQLYNPSLVNPYTVIAIESNQHDLLQLGYQRFNDRYVKEFKPGDLTKRMTDIHRFFAPFVEEDPLFVYEPWFLSRYLDNIDEFSIHLVKTGVADRVTVQPHESGYHVSFSLQNSTTFISQVEELTDVCREHIENMHRINRLNTVFETPRTHFTIRMEELGIAEEQFLEPLHKAILSHFKDGESMELFLSTWSIRNVSSIVTTIKGYEYALYRFPWCTAVKGDDIQIFDNVDDAKNHFEQTLLQATMDSPTWKKYQQI